jgi:hypothetical protein
VISICILAIGQIQFGSGIKIIQGITLDKLFNLLLILLMNFGLYTRGGHEITRYLTIDNRS